MQNTNAATELLNGIIADLERIESVKTNLNEEAKEVLANAKAHGLDPKMIRKILKIRKKTPAEQEQEQGLLETYCAAIKIDLFGNPL